MILGSFLFGIALFFIAVFIFIETLNYPYKAMLFPLLTLCPVLFLLIMQIISEVPALKARDAFAKDLGKAFSRGHLVIGLWMAGALMILWLCGFIATVVLLPLLYLRYQREGWVFSVVTALTSGIFFYVLFDLGLKMPLYPGILLSRLAS